MHIALFSPGWPLERFHNGIVTFVHWMRAELEHLGHRVSVFVPEAACLEAGLRVYPVTASSFGKSWRRLSRRLGFADDGFWDWGKVLGASILDVHRKDPIDVIEMEESFGWFHDVQAVTHIPLLVKLHGPAFLSLIDHELDSVGGKMRIEREGIALRSARAIAAPSRDTLRRTLERYVIDPAIQAHVTNPVCVDTALPMWRPQLGVSSLLFVGRFDKRKGADLVLEAFARLATDFPALSLTFVGPDRGLLQSDGTQVHFEEFCRQSFSPEVRARIDFHGHQSPSEIAALRSKAGAVLVASRWENQGYTLIEAMQQGCPVVASAVGGNPESVTHRHTGLLFAPGQGSDLASQVRELLDDPKLAADVGAAAREYVVEHHSASRVACDSLALYKRLASKPQRRR